MPRPRSDRTILVLIGAFKLLKAAFLIAVGIGALRYLHRDIAAAVTHWTEVLRIDPENRHIHGLLTRILQVTPKQLKELSAGTFVYAGLFLVEGIGLLLEKRWAEYFTIVTTGGLVPLEVYEMTRHFTIGKVLVLLVNVLIVVYLVWRVRSKEAA